MRYRLYISHINDTDQEVEIPDNEPEHVRQDLLNYHIRSFHRNRVVVKAEPLSPSQRSEA